MRIEKQEQNDKLLVKACKQFYLNTPSLFSIGEIIIDGIQVKLDKTDMLRLAELAEIGLESLETTAEKEAEPEVKQDKCSDKQELPHFKHNDTSMSDCEKCLCSTCVTPCAYDNACAEHCFYKVNCKEDEYVDSCPHYNDGHE